MKQPEVLLVPVLMLVEYYLGVAGAVLKQRKYAEHFDHWGYSGDPLSLKTAVPPKWFNPRYLLITVVVSGLYALVLEFADLPDAFLEGVIGCIFMAFALTIGRHLSNFLSFLRMARSPDEITGQVTMTRSLTLAVSGHQFLTAAVPVTMLAIAAPTPFALGGLVCVWLMLPCQSLAQRYYEWAARKAG